MPVRGRLMLALRMPWAVQFIRRHLPYMSLSSACRYLRLERRKVQGLQAGEDHLRLRLKSPMRGDVWVRFGTSDLRTLCEVVFIKVYNEVTEALNDCEFIIDLGGNIGLASRFFASRYPGSQVLAVEPEEQNLELYRRNMRCIPEYRWEVLQAAMWRADEQVNLSAPPNNSDCGPEFDSIQVGTYTGSGEKTVPGLTMKSLIKRSGFPRVDLLKIDIEGAEVELFHGDLSWLDRVRAIAIEFHSDARLRSRFDAVMTERGFNIRELNGHTVLAAKL